MIRRDLSVGFRVSDDYVAQHPEADPSATELAINVFLAAELLYARMDRLLSRFDVSRGAFNMLQVLHGADGPVSPTDVSEQLIVSTATITGLTDTLVRRGFVVRLPHPSDRRRILLEATPEAADLLEEIGRELIEREKAWAAGLRPDDRERLVRLLGRFQQHLRTLDPEP